MVSSQLKRTSVLLGLFLALNAAPAGAACNCPVDVNADGTVNIDDLVLVITNWGTAHAGADINDSGAVDIDDLVQVITSWNQICPIPGVFPAVWTHGAANCSQNPPAPIQIHQYNADTYILRQSKCTNFEGPFMYLLFGQDKVLMQDTGAGGIQIRTAVMGIINQWLAVHNQASIQLIVTHSHSHGDHVAGDLQFVGQPNTTVVGTTQAAVAAFFGITSWPTQIVQYDLGSGRIIDVIPIPGHQSAHIALYDRKSGILLTGDTLYPGRLYMNGAFTTFRTSVARLVNFTNAPDKPVCWVLGTHIEMTNTPLMDYPVGTTYQPNEHLLQLTRDHLLELHNSLQAMGSGTFQVHNDFIIVP